MKLVTLDNDTYGDAGVVLSDGTILNLSLIKYFKPLKASDIELAGSDILTILQNEQLDRVRRTVEWVEHSPDSIQETLRYSGVIVNASDATFQPVIPNPSFILAQGLAYRKHLSEMNVPLPKQPVSLFKSPGSLTGNGCPIILPENYPDMVDWEGEFSIVIGKPCHNVSANEAMDYVAGYTIINDVSARDWTAAALNPDQSQMEAVMTWADNVQGKQFPTFTPMGPVMVTADEIDDPHALQLTTKVNGEVMQDTSTSDLIFPIDVLISHFSKWFMFRPGDVITTGSPAGVGYGRNPKVFLKPGDICDITVTNIGTLSNPVISHQD
jgi:acylpyruvate hydrolase